MTQGIESLGRVRLQGLALLFVAFLAGVVAGVAGERARATRSLSSEQGFRRPMRAGTLPPFYERLGLSEQQRNQIQEIFDSSRPRTDSILQSTFPRIRAITDSVRAEIRNVLTAEQREQLDRELESRFRRMRELGPRAPGRRRPGRMPPPR